MTKKQKSAKKSFISSVLVLCLCFTMFVGTTYAWYNDSVESGRNTIVAGSLEMVLERYVPATDTETAKWETVDSNTKLFSDSASFEPGAAQVAYVRVKNDGDLAFKYSLALKIDSEDPGENKAGATLKLSNYLKFGAVQMANDTFAPYPKTDAGRATAIAAAGTNNISISDFVTAAVLQKETTSDVYALIIYMPSSLGNEVNPDPDHKPSITFGLNALATQATVENDSFSDQYDVDAPLPFTPVANLTQLSAAIAEDGTNALLTDDIDTSDRVEITNNTTIDGQGNTIKVDNQDNRVIDVSDTTDPVVLNLNNVVVDASDAKVDNAYPRGVSLYGNEDVTLNVSGTTIKAPHYAVNVASANKDVEINLENASVLDAWAGINIWSKSDINVKDSTIIGTNDKTYNAEGWNNFGTIVVNYDGTATTSNGSVLNFENTTIKAITTTGNRQAFILLGDDNITATFTNCTFIAEGTPNNFTDMLVLLCMNEKLTFTNCKFIKNGVEVDIKDYIGFYEGNKDDSCVITVNGVVLDNALIPEITD